MDVFLFAANAVLPILLLILLGYFLRQKGILSPDFLKTGNDLVFRICLPCMLFSSVYSIGSLEQISWSAVLFALAAALVIWLVGIPLVKRFVPDPKRKGVRSEEVEVDFLFYYITRICPTSNTFENF